MARRQWGVNGSGRCDVRPSLPHLPGHGTASIGGGAEGPEGAPAEPARGSPTCSLGGSGYAPSHASLGACPWKRPLSSQGLWAAWCGPGAAASAPCDPRGCTGPAWGWKVHLGLFWGEPGPTGLCLVHPGVPQPEHAPPRPVPGAQVALWACAEVLGLCHACEKDAECGTTAYLNMPGKDAPRSWPGLRAQPGRVKDSEHRLAMSIPLLKCVARSPRKGPMGVGVTSSPTSQPRGSGVCFVWPAWAMSRSHLWRAQLGA